MGEHYPKSANGLTVIAWCETCRRDTPHRVEGGRRGPCVEHGAPHYSKEQLKRIEKREKESKQPKLF
jgi:hypothetical protein